MKINDKLIYIPLSLIIGVAVGISAYKCTYQKKLFELMEFNEISASWRESLYLEQLNNNNSKKLKEILELKLKTVLEHKNDSLKLIPDKNKEKAKKKYSEIESRYKDSASKESNK